MPTLAPRIGLVALLAATSLLPAQPQPAPATAPSGVAKIQAESEALYPLVKSELAKRFLDAAAALPSVEKRTIYRDPENNWLTAAKADALPEEERAKLKAAAIDENRYYTTKYGSPLAYVRALDLAATCEADPPLKSLEGARVLDYGYGTVGHLRLMASLGAHTTGVDVDSFLTAIYSEPTDVGTVPGYEGAPDGSITLASGRFPADEPATSTVKNAAPEGYDLITAKNTLKNGYINPARPVDPRMLVNLGVSHDAFIKALFDHLRPGGLVVIYNLSPAPSKDDEPYKPWSDGRCPFPRESLEAAGFRVIAFDENDDAAARRLAKALGWDQGGMDLEKDLFGHYTILQRPAR